MKLIDYVLIIWVICFLSLPAYARTSNKPSIFSRIDNNGYIQSLVDDIQVNRDGSLDVTETIILQNPDNFQRNAFIRFFPYPLDLNLLIRPKYLIDQISLDNKFIIDNNAKVSTYQNYYTVAIFQQNIGLTTYTIHYHDYYGIKLQKDEDQLIWLLNNINLTMPFNYIEYNILFPSDIELVSYSAILGTNKENDKSYVMQHAMQNNQQNVRFYTTRAIQYPESFAILILMKKGVFSSPFTIDTILKYFTPEIYLAYIISILFFFYSLYYYSSLTKNQKLGYPNIINSISSPPENLTPSEVAYMTESDDKKLILTYITSLLMKGYFILDLNLGKYIYQQKPLDALPAGEKMISNRVISFQDKDLYSGPSTILSAELKKNINQYYVKRYLQIFCLILTLGVFVLIDYAGNKLSFPKYEYIGIAGGKFLINMMGIYLVFYLFSGLNNFSRPITKLHKFFSRIIFLIIGIGVIFLNILALLYYYPLSYLLPLLILIYPNFLGLKYFKLFNQKGNAVYQQILGFKNYLLNSNQFQLSSYEFEKYLPYAIALNIENEWAEKFKSIYPHKYQPQWIIPEVDIATLPGLIKIYTDFTITVTPFKDFVSRIKAKIRK
jgi:hypothetical protein